MTVVHNTHKQIHTLSHTDAQCSDVNQFGELPGLFKLSSPAISPPLSQENEYLQGKAFFQHQFTDSVFGMTQA